MSPQYFGHGNVLDCLDLMRGLCLFVVWFSKSNRIHSYPRQFSIDYDLKMQEMAS